jgi:hypothetical protein
LSVESSCSPWRRRAKACARSSRHFPRRRSPRLCSGHIRQAQCKQAGETAQKVRAKKRAEKSRSLPATSSGTQKCRAYGAWRFYISRTQRLRAGLSSAAPTALRERRIVAPTALRLRFPRPRRFDRDVPTEGIGINARRAGPVRQAQGTFAALSVNKQDEPALRRHEKRRLPSTRLAGLRDASGTKARRSAVRHFAHGAKD